MLYEIIFCPCSCLKVLRVSEHTVCGREAPKNSRIQDSTFVGILHDCSIAFHLTVISTIFHILHLQPKGQDVLLKHFFDFTL